MAHLNHIVDFVFGDSFSQNVSAASGGHRKNGDLESLLTHVTHELQIFDLEPCSNVNTSDLPNQKIDRSHADGRIGNHRVCFDVKAHVGMFIIGRDRLSLCSQSNFSTIRANCGVYKGKWQYEVLLASTGIMQLGWATIHSKFSQEIGVGDTPDSFAYDGNRVRRWNVSIHKYGESWQKDDVIGCCMDLDEGSIEFFRNGRSMGVAFNQIPMGEGIVYFPTVSLTILQGLEANFGSTPFCYPVHGFQPLQDPPEKILTLTSCLLDRIGKLLTLMDDSTKVHDLIPSPEAAQLVIARLLMSKLLPLFMNPYVVEARFVPFIRELCEPNTSSLSHAQVRPSARVTAQRSSACASQPRKLHTFIDLLMLFSEEYELKEWVHCLASCLMSKFQCSTMVLEYASQRDALLVLNRLIGHKLLRHYFLKNVLFDNIRILWFMSARLNESVLESLITKVWWETDQPDPSIEINKRAYVAGVNKIKMSVNGLEEMQIELIFALLDNSDGSSMEPSSRRIFLRKFRSFLSENLNTCRHQSLRSMETLVGLSWCFFHRLLLVLKALWSQEVGDVVPTVPPSTFYDGSVNFFCIDRLGGVLSHLRKTLRTDLEQRLGPSHPSLQLSDIGNDGSQAPQTSVETGTSTGAIFTAYAASTSAGNNIVSPTLARLLIQPGLSPPDAGASDTDVSDEKGPVDSQASLIELLDGLILLYHIAVHKHIKKVSAVGEAMDKYVKALADTQERIDAFNSSPVKQPPEILNELQSSYNVLFKHISKWSSRMALVRAFILSNEKQAAIVWLLNVVLSSVQVSSDDGPLFKFTPEFYLDCLFEMFMALSILMPPLSLVEDLTDHMEILKRAIQFICDHISDPRIRTGKSKDTLIKALTSIMSNSTLVQIVESVPELSRLNMIHFLLQPYENRAWAHSNWVLARIWQGSPNAFAFRTHRSAYHRSKLRPRLVQPSEFSLNFENDACSSHVLQVQVCEVLLREPEVATPFLNSVLNQLNWSFSEFIGMLQEIQNVSHRTERVLIESRQLKTCATCFDLTLSLLRVLEMVATLALPVFTDQERRNSDLLLARLCQLLCQVLNRASSQAGCFHHVTLLEIPDLQNVDHFPILTAVCGILVAIFAKEVEGFSVSDSTVPRVAKELLLEPSFQMASLSFLVEDNPHFFSLNNYTEEITTEEITRVKHLLNMLDHYYHLVMATSTSTATNDEDEMCTICYAFPIAAAFEPCKHHSCRACITHHLMNCKECFFCKTVITKVVDPEGKTIYELPPPTILSEAT